MYESVNMVGKTENEASDAEDKCDSEGKDRWRLNNVSVLVPALISHCSQERCILL